jgi:hypothetical protein
MINDFRNFVTVNESELLENSLFTTQAERDALVQDKPRVATAFLFNFFGMLGMINATKPAQKRTVLSYLQKDKKLRIDTIDDTNHDISLSLKLAHEAGFFVSDVTVAEITRFLVKLKAGQIDHVDSVVAAKWAAGMKPDFAINLTVPKMRAVFNDFRADGGKTIDVSRFAVVLKTVANKVGDSGDFKSFSKRFFGLTEIAPTVTTPVVAAIPVAPTQTAVPAKLNYYQRQKLKKQAAAQATAQPAAAVAQPAALAAPKLSYYQRQKLQKDAAKQATAKIEAERIAAERAAAELRAKEEEENRRAKAAAVKSITREDFDKMVDLVGKDGKFNSYVFSSSGPILQRMFGFDVVPDLYAAVAEQLQMVSYSMYNVANAYSYSDIQPYVKNVRSALATIQQKTGYKLTIEDLVRKTIKTVTTGNMGGAGGKYVAAALANDTPITKEFYRDTIAKFNIDGIRSLANMVTQAGKSKTDEIVDVIVSDKGFIDQMIEERGPVHSAFDVTRAWGSNTPKYHYNTSYSGSAEFGVSIIQRLSNSFTDVVEMVMNSGSYAHWVIAAASIAYGTDASEIENLDPQYVSIMRSLFAKFLKTDFIKGFENVKRRIFSNDYAHLKYNASSPTKGGPIISALHDEYAPDLIANGWVKSKLADLTKLKMSNHAVKYILSGIGVDLDDLIAKHPNDVASVYFKAMKDGLGSIDSKQLAEAILAEAGPTAKAGDIMRTANGFIGNAFGDRDANNDAIAKSLLDIAKTRSKDFATKDVGQTLMKLLPYTSQETTNGWLKLAKDTNNQWIMGPELYKNIDKSYKQGYVDILTGIVQDSIGTDVEDYVNGIMEDLPMHVVQKMRGNLVGASVMIDEINKGEIKPFDKIDAARLKKIFLYNDLNMSALLTGVIDKKKKSETYTQFFNRAKQTMSTKSVIDPAKVKADPNADSKAINKIMVQRDHAGKHGDTYPKIIKVFDASIEYPEFWEFRKKKPKDGSVVPAYHGTGGIAAGMILRYGFKVIKSTDPSVVGRMLGDGIYFSNKIDKVSQYVSNGGYSRKHGQKGYIMELDVNLGTNRVDYRSAGVGGGDNIRSPEWCVVDPKAQLRIVKAYEVELVSKATVDKHLNEGVQSHGLMRFKSYLKEQDMFNVKNMTTFVFRDGMIPIVNQDTSEVTFVDFEEALAKKLITTDMYDVTGQGPAVIFSDAPEQLSIDERFASHMGGDDLQLYIRLYRNKMFGG